jgi:hypothetical protein
MVCLVVVDLLKSAVMALHLYELFEQGQVLLVLEQGANQRRNADALILALQR